MNELISVASLKKHLAKREVLVFDCRFNLMDAAAGHEAYLAGHIPGAVYADLNRQLSSPHIPGLTGRHPLPDRTAWLAQVQQWGITPDKLVVAYDDAGGAFAARLWWLLRWIGHEQVSVLNGGWKAWLAAKGESRAGEEAVRRASGKEYATLTSLCREVRVTSVNAENYLLIDARDLIRFTGEKEPIDPVAGHIPGAVCSPMSGNLDEQGCFKTPEQLKEKFSGLQDAEKELLCYCGSGVTAIHNILALKLAGFEEPILYAGSWSEWITDPSRPVARGSE
jgi:thiosulfate/3-mercaptopyruvate sulfurtransferase